MLHTSTSRKETSHHTFLKLTVAEVVAFVELQRLCFDNEERASTWFACLRTWEQRIGRCSPTGRTWARTSMDQFNASLSCLVDVDALSAVWTRHIAIRIRQTWRIKRFHPQLMISRFRELQHVHKLDELQANPAKEGNKTNQVEHRINLSSAVLKFRSEITIESVISYGCEVSSRKVLRHLIPTSLDFGALGLIVSFPQVPKAAQHWMQTRESSID